MHCGSKPCAAAAGVVENINFHNLEMSDIQNACISFDMYYQVKKPTTRKSATKPSVDSDAVEPDAPVGEGAEVRQEPAKPVDAGTPQFRGITIRNINCTGTNIGMQLRGLAGDAAGKCDDRACGRLSPSRGGR